MAETPELEAPKSSVPKAVEKNNKANAWTAKRAKDVLDELIDNIKDDDGFDTVWESIVNDASIIRNGKRKSMEEVAKVIRNECEIQEDITLQGLRSKETMLGRIMTAIIFELNKASVARDTLNERKKDYLADAKDRRKSQAVIESELVKINPEFKMIRNITMSSDLNYKFWKSMYDMVNMTFDRLKQIGISLTAEARLDRSLYEDAPSRGTERRNNQV